MGFPRHRRRTRALLVLLGAVATAACRLSAADLLICGTSYSEQRAAVVRLAADETGARLEVVDSAPLDGGGCAIAWHPRHRLLYTLTKERNCRVFTIAATGRLEPVHDAALHGGYCFLALDREGRHLLGASYESGAVDVYRLDAAGFPDELTASRDEGRTMAHSVAVTPDDRFAYAGFVKESSGLFQYRFDAARGSLEPLDPPQPELPAGSGPRHLVFHPTKPFVYFSNEQQLGVSVLRIGADGRLTLVEEVAAPGAKPSKGLAGSDIVITPDGKFVYVGVRGFEDPLQAVFAYRIGDDGRLAAAGTTATDAIPWALAMAPDGRRLFVSAARAGTLTSYRIAADGSLEREAAVEIGKDFWALTVVPAAE